MDDVVSLIEREIPHLRRYARYLTRNVDSADDLVQDALVLAITNVSKWEPGTNLRAWLFAILRNSFLNGARRARRNPTNGDFESIASALGVPPNQEHAYYLRQLSDFVATLPPDQQEVLLIIVIDGVSYEEASQILSVPVGTIRSRLSRARGALRKSMDNATGWLGSSDASSQDLEDGSADTADSKRTRSPRDE